MALGADLASTRPPCVSATSKGNHVKRETGSESCRIALWDFFGNAVIFFIGYYKIALETGSEFVLQNNPIMQFDTTKTQSQVQHHTMVSKLF